MISLIGIGEGRAQEVVDAHLITGLDVSASMNSDKLNAEIDGMTAALLSPRVLGVIQGGKNHKILFSVFVWSEKQRLVVDRVIASEQDVQAVVIELGLLKKKYPVDLGSLTDMSKAMEFADALFYAGYQSGFLAQRRILNVVGDGEDNTGESPDKIRAGLIGKGVTINGVAIMPDKQVMQYFLERVRGGKFSFVIAVNKKEDIIGAMISKFSIEIADASR